MKLLAKSEVAKAKSVDRQREIAEGVKLAGRVDTLREIAVAEEASLSKFRRETIANINEELVKETKRLEGLRGEVKELESRKAEALAPLTDKWSELEELENSLDQRCDALSSKEDYLESREEDLVSRERIAARNAEAIGYTQADARERLADAAILKENAEKMAKDATEILENAHKEAKTIRAEIAEREGEVKEREKAATAKDRDLQTREKNLAEASRKLDTLLRRYGKPLEEYMRLKDREGVIARNIKRVKK